MVRPLPRRPYEVEFADRPAREPSDRLAPLRSAGDDRPVLEELNPAPAERREPDRVARGASLLVGREGVLTLGEARGGVTRMLRDGGVTRVIPLEEEDEERFER